MTEKPILFSGPMVRAILEGRKTQTRRVLKPQPQPVGGPFYQPHPTTSPREWHSISKAGHIANIQKVAYAVGDRLWVREAWRADPAHDRTKPSDLDANTVRINYEADGVRFESGKLRPSMFMCRWMSRITLEVTAVKVERLQAISADDAEAEGLWRGKARKHLFWQSATECRLLDGRSHKQVFGELWESINGPGSWNRNDWVVAYTFRRVTE